MSLTNCPSCQQLCFLDSASCQGCGQQFQPDTLRVRAAAQELAFQRKVGALFFTVLLALLAVLLFVTFRR